VSAGELQLCGEKRTTAHLPLPGVSPWAPTSTAILHGFQSKRAQDFHWPQWAVTAPMLLPMHVQSFAGRTKASLALL